MLVYRITRKATGKSYVGQTRQTIEQRWRRHCWVSTRKSNMPIACAIARHGADAFEIVELEVCADQAALDAAELKWALELETFVPSGYNLRAGAGRGAVSAETRAKISAAQTGRRISEATRENLRRSHKGLKMSEAARRALKEHYAGRCVSPLGPQAAAVANAKSYRLVTPTGEVVTVTNMREHCRANNLSPHKMCEVVKQRMAQHKGWRLAGG